MRHGAAGRRQRNRGHNGSNGAGRRNPNPNQRSQVYDSNGPEVRIRGTAHQVAEKYMNLAKDAASAGDRVLAESYLQHAEHYTRIIGSWEPDVRSETGENFGEDTRFNRQPTEPVYKPVDNVRKNDDLSLPASILGAPFQAEGKVTVVASGPVRADQFIPTEA